MIKGNNETFFENKFLLSGSELKVSIGQFAPGTMVYRNSLGNVTGYGGYIYEQLQWISNLLNFSLAMVTFDDNANNIWNEMRGQIRRREIDIACHAFNGYGFYDILDLVILVLSDSYGLLTKYPTPKVSNYGHVLIFSPSVWIGLMISILGCISCIQLIICLKRKYFTQINLPGFNTLTETCIYVLATLTNHGGYYRSGCRSTGVVAAMWCLATFVFVNIYCSCLTSYMSLITQRPDINSYRDLATNPNYQPSIVNGSIPEAVFRDAKSGTWKELGHKLKQCNEGICSLKNNNLAAKKVLDGNFAAILPSGYIRSILHKDNSPSNCNLTMGQETIFYRHYFTAVPKKSLYAQELNKASLWWHAFGMQDYWLKKTKNEKGSPCLLNFNEKDQSVKLLDKVQFKLEQFIVAFVALFVGYVLALVQFLRERLIRY